METILFLRAAAGRGKPEAVHILIAADRDAHERRNPLYRADEIKTTSELVT